MLSIHTAIAIHLDRVMVVHIDACIAPKQGLFFTSSSIASCPSMLVVLCEQDN